MENKLTLKSLNQDNKKEKSTIKFNMNKESILFELKTNKETIKGNIAPRELCWFAYKILRDFDNLKKTNN